MSLKRTKRIISLLLVTILVLSGCGAKEETSSTSQEPEQQEIETTDISSTETETPSENDDIIDIDAVGDVSVEKELFDVIITVPADFLGEQTQEDLDALCSEKGFESITLNEDDSATYVMTKGQHKSLMEEYKDTINSSLTELINSENYPSFTDIQANSDFTDFTITTTSTSLDMNESFSVMVFYMYGGMYNVFNGTTVENVRVTFVNADTGEVISTANSADMGE